MYTLSLTHSERKAIDWIGHRYDHGDELRAVLENAMQEIYENYDCNVWDVDSDIVFHVPEHLAWAIREIGEECEYRWDCFAEPLCEKLNTFCNQVV